MTEPQSTLPPRFEIVRDKDMPRRPTRRAAPSVVGTFCGAIRTVIEDAYVSLAQEAMVRVEQLEDLRAVRGHTARVRKTDRQRLRRQQQSAVASVTPAAAKSAG